MKTTRIAILTASLAQSAIAVESAQPAKPNILFILVDDYGIRDVGVEGSTFYETTNIYALSRSGMRFTQGYAACQVCSPSRASILNGQTTACHGITDYIGASVGGDFAQQRGVKLSVPNCARRLSKANLTLAQAFKNAGYATFFAGKWHLGDKGFWPENYGYDIIKGGWSAGQPDAYYAPWENPRLPSGPRSESLTGRLASETISFIEQYSDKHFPAYLSFYAVHGPIQTTRTMWKKYHDKAATLPPPDSRFIIDRTQPGCQVQDNPVYACMIEEMYTAVGRVLTRLQKLGLDKNTIQGGEPSSIIQKNGWKLIHYWEDNRNELYRLADDIGEQNDLAQKEPAHTFELWKEFSVWLEQNGAKYAAPYAKYNPASADKTIIANQQLKERLEKENANQLNHNWQPNNTWWNSLVLKD